MSNRFIPDRDEASPTGTAAAALPTATAIPRGPALFTPGQVALASGLGGPLAGGILLGWSHRRAGAPRAWLPVVLGAFATALLLGVGWYMPGTTGSFLPFLGVMAMRQLAQQLEPELIRAAGGVTQRARWLAPVVLGLGILGASVGVIVVAGGGFDMLRSYKSVSFGHDQEVQYTSGATEADARQVGSFLMEAGLFEANGRGKTVRIARSGGDLEVSFVLAEGAWDDAGATAAFTEVATQLGPRFPGARVIVHLCDDHMRTKRTLP